MGFGDRPLGAWLDGDGQRPGAAHRHRQFHFSALAVEKGLNRLRFSYCPFGYPWLLIASWLCWGGVFAAPAVSGARAMGSAWYAKMRPAGKGPVVSTETPSKRRRAA